MLVPHNCRIRCKHKCTVVSIWPEESVRYWQSVRECLVPGMMMMMMMMMMMIIIIIIIIQKKTPSTTNKDIYHIYMLFEFK